MGDKLYNTYTLTESTYSELEVVSIENKNLDSSQWGRDADEQYRLAGFATKLVVKCKDMTSGRSYTYDITSRDLINKYSNYYAVKPHKTEDIK